MSEEDLIAGRAALCIMEKAAADYLYGPADREDEELWAAISKVVEALGDAKRIIKERLAQS